MGMCDGRQRKMMQLEKMKFFIFSKGVANVNTLN